MILSKISFPKPVRATRKTALLWRGSRLHEGVDSPLNNERIETLKTIASNRKLMAAGKAICHVYQTFSQILTSAKSARNLMRQHANEIVNTIIRIEPALGLKRAIRLFSITAAQFHAWKRKVSCKSSPLLLCRSQHPLQLAEKEIGNIKKYLFNPETMHWPLISVYWKMMREGEAYMGKSTFYKYAARLFAHRNDLRIKKNRPKTGIRASAPLQLLQMDVTIYRANQHTKVYIFLIIDNFSRAILGCKAALRCTAQIAFENLKEVCHKHHLFYKTITLLTDDGPENNGEVTQYLLQPEVDIEKLVAQRDIIFSNSMIEAVNKQLKYQYLFTKELPDYEAVLAYLPQAIDDYNNRPHYALHGLTPAEALNGKTPQKHRYADKIAAAKLARMQLNKQNTCGICLPI